MERDVTLRLHLDEDDDNCLDDQVCLDGECVGEDEVPDAGTPADGGFDAGFDAGVVVDAGDEDAGPGHRQKNDKGGWDLTGGHPANRLLRD